MVMKPLGDRSGNEKLFLNTQMDWQEVGEIQHERLAPGSQTN